MKRYGRERGETPLAAHDRVTVVPLTSTVAPDASVSSVAPSRSTELLTATTIFASCRPDMEVLKSGTAGALISSLQLGPT